MLGRISLATGLVTALGCTAAFPFEEGPAPRLLDDGFEKDPGPWLFTSDGEALANVREGTVHGGALALCAEASASSTAVATAGFETVTGGDLWLRAHFFLRQASAAGLVVVARLVESGPTHVQIELFQNDALQALLYDREGQYRGAGSWPTTLPRARWGCLELHVALSSTAGEIELHLDGTRVAHMGELDTLPAEGFDRVVVGVMAGEEQAGTVQLCVDDVAVATERLGCE